MLPIARNTAKINSRELRWMATPHAHFSELASNTWYDRKWLKSILSERRVLFTADYVIRIPIVKMAINNVTDGIRNGDRNQLKWSWNCWPPYITARLPFGTRHIKTNRSPRNKSKFNKYDNLASCVAASAHTAHTTLVLGSFLFLLCKTLWNRLISNHFVFGKLNRLESNGCASGKMIYMIWIDLTQRPETETCTY